MAPQVDYITQVFLPQLWKMVPAGRDAVSISCKTRGFFPRGGGEILLETRPLEAPLLPIDLTERGELKRIHGYAYCAGSVKPSVASRMRDSAVRTLREVLGKARLDGVVLDVEVVRCSPEEAVGDGCGLLLFADFAAGPRLGASGLGARGVTAEKVGEDAARVLAQDILSGACVDEYLQDQLVIFASLARGTSRIRAGPEVSMHTKTALHFVELLTGATTKVTPQDDGTNVIEIEGIGWFQK
jgi:RNA 3'-terminal phosphate cyclase (ATP)